MSGVMVPQKKPGMLGTLLPIAGAVAGGVATGGLGGAAAGQALGGAAGGMFGANKQGPGAVESNAINRRIETMQPAQAPAADLAAADAALGHLPEPLQQQYRPAIQRARAMSGGVA